MLATSCPHNLPPKHTHPLECATADSFSGKAQAQTFLHLNPSMNICMHTTTTTPT